MPLESALLFLVRSLSRFRWSSTRTIQQFLRLQAEALDGLLNPGPFFREKFLTLALQQKIPRAVFDEHAETSPLFDQFLVHQFLIPLEDRERIEPVISGDVPHRRQRIAFLEHAVEN